MNRKAPLTRKTRIRARNPKRKGHRFPKNVREHFRAWVREQPCCVTGCLTGAYHEHPTLGMVRVEVQPAHVKSRGSGGPDVRNIVPLTWLLHRELDGKLRTAAFNAKYGVDLEALARTTWDAYLREHPEQALDLDPTEPPYWRADD